MKFKEKPVSLNALSQRSLLYGVGINDADYCVNYCDERKKIRCPFYDKWKCMMTRCYSLKHLNRHPAYLGCSVSEDWLTFSKFKKWMITQQWEGNVLDKDFLVDGNKQYSADTCLFIPNYINVLLSGSGRRKGEFPTGVCFDKERGKYMAKANRFGKNFIGRYDTIQEAENAYSRVKSEYITSLIPTIEDDYPKLVEPLKRIAKKLTENI